MSTFYFIYLHAIFFLYLSIVNRLYTVINKLYTMVNNLLIIINKFYVDVSNLHTIITNLFTKKVFLLIVLKVNMKSNKNSKIRNFCRKPDAIIIKLLADHALSLSLYILVSPLG